MRRSTEATKLLAQLNIELAEASAAAGEQLVWSAAETELLKFLGDAIDRKCALARAFDGAESASAKLSFSAEIRLLETHIGKLLKDIRTDLPQPVTLSSATSTASRNGTKAANSRWKRQRMATGQA
jgi:hypothetical protein